MKKAVVSYSGGMDSTCLLMHLLNEGYEIRAYSFDYGQNHNVELKLAKKNVRYLKKLGFPIEHQVINLKDVFSGDPSTLVQHTQAPYGDYRDETMKSTVVNNRNVIFSAIIFAKALSWAKSENNNVVISMGVHKGDMAIYPDCTEESVTKARELYKISNWNSELVDYNAPFVGCTKAEVLGAGLKAMKELNLSKAQIRRILRNTMSCYNAKDGMACGKCGTCRERLEAFYLNKMKDPIKYDGDYQELLDDVISYKLDV